MKFLILPILIFLIGCESDKKLEKIKINPEDTKITKEKINKSIQDIDDVIDKPFQLQQNINKGLKNFNKERRDEAKNEKE